MSRSQSQLSPNADLIEIERMREIHRREFESFVKTAIQERDYYTLTRLLQGANQ